MLTFVLSWKLLARSTLKMETPFIARFIFIAVRNVFKTLRTCTLLHKSFPRYQVSIFLSNSIFLSRLVCVILCHHFIYENIMLILCLQRVVMIRQWRRRSKFSLIYAYRWFLGIKFDRLFFSYLFLHAFFIQHVSQQGKSILYWHNEKKFMQERERVDTSNSHMAKVIACAFSISWHYNYTTLIVRLICVVSSTSLLPVMKI